MNDDKLTLAILEDKREQCENNYMITNTGFLDMRQQTLCKNAARGSATALGFYYGGYEDAERKIAVFVPEYTEIKNTEELQKYFAENPEDNPLALLRAKHSGYKELSHRDYLGSLTGLGIKRESIGDILVSKTGADVVMLRELAEFLLLNYSKAGRTELELSIVKPEELVIPEGHTEEKGCTVASLRLDNVIAAAFGMSRSSAAEAVKRGIVFVNSMQVEKLEKTINQGDKLVVRGKGKVILKEIGGSTRKDRIFITITIMK